MHTQSHHLLPWASAVLAVLGCGPLVTWAVTLCNYGIYVDEHGLWGVARPIEAALSVSGAREHHRSDRALHRVAAAQRLDSTTTDEAAGRWKPSRRFCLSGISR